LGVVFALCALLAAALCLAASLYWYYRKSVLTESEKAEYARISSELIETQILADEAQLRAEAFESELLSVSALFEEKNREIELLRMQAKSYEEKLKDIKSKRLAFSDYTFPDPDEFPFLLEIDRLRNIESEYIKKSSVVDAIAGIFIPFGNSAVTGYIMKDDFNAKKNLFMSVCIPNFFSQNYFAAALSKANADLAEYKATLSYIDEAIELSRSDERLAESSALMKAMLEGDALDESLKEMMLNIRDDIIMSFHTGALAYTLYVGALDKCDETARLEEFVTETKNYMAAQKWLIMPDELSEQLFDAQSAMIDEYTKAIDCIMESSAIDPNIATGPAEFSFFRIRSNRVSYFMKLKNAGTENNVLKAEDSGPKGFICYFSPWGHPLYIESKSSGEYAYISPESHKVFSYAGDPVKLQAEADLWERVHESIGKVSDSELAMEIDGIRNGR
jgi:hypothetical protein